MTAVALPQAKPLRISHSKANTWRRCPKSYEFKYVHKLRKKQVGLPLKRGDWLHQLLMVHYDGHDWHERHALLSAEFNKLFDEEKEEYGDLPTECARIFKSYLAHYRREDAKLVVVDSEVDELVELPNGDVLNVIIDLVVEDADGSLWAWDHKTVGRFMHTHFQLIDPQLARYDWAMRKLGYPLHGWVYNEIITTPPTLPKPLKTGGLQKRKNIRCDVYSYYGEIKRLGLDPKDYQDFLKMLKARSDQWFRRTRIPRDKPMVKQVMRELMMTAREIKEGETRGHFPRTIIKGDCETRCDYTEPCIIEMQGGDISDVVRDRYTISKRRGEEHTGWASK